MMRRCPRALARGWLLASWAASAGALAWSCAAGDEGGAGPLDLVEAGVVGPDGAEDSATPDGTAPSPGDDAGNDVSTSDDAGVDGGGPGPQHDAGADTGTPIADARADAPAIDAAALDAAGPDTGTHVDAAVDSSAPDTGSGTDAGCSPALVVVNEVQTSGAGGAEDEWVELFNPGGCAVDLTGWTLRHASQFGTTGTTVFTAGAATIGARGYAVVGGLVYTASAATIGSFTAAVFADTGGGIGLYDASGTLVDGMGYGTGATNMYVETTAAPVEGASQSIARLPNGSKTGDNSRDFGAATPTPGGAN